MSNKCPNCGTPGGGESGCSACGLGPDPNVGNHIEAGQDQIRIRQEQERRQRESVTDCFPGDALVLTPRGYIRIDEVRKGDSVLSPDEEGILRPTHVNRIVSHRSHAVLKVVSQTQGLSFGATKRHPVETARGWVRIRDLKPGDSLTHIENNGSRVMHKVQRVEETRRVEPVYNIIVGGNHTYIVRGCVAHSFVYFRALRMLLSRIRRVVAMPFEIIPEPSTQQCFRTQE